MANHQFTLQICGGTRKQAEDFIHALFYDGAAEGPTLVGRLLDEYIDEEAGVIVQ
ncbi:hypothetical protein [Mycobacteroides chelonae]|uniref:hypothetical protein n=1 Tax=Mycobacteroides chelonae TaxID=1774 RepID=UPI0013F4DF37|nr:hypothetical protein [Mycobacteroides chelonae]